MVGPAVYDESVGSVAVVFNTRVTEWSPLLEADGSRRTDWVLTNDSSPTPLDFAAVTYDPVEARVVAWTASNQTLIRKSHPRDRPAGIFAVAWGEAGVTQERIQAIDVRATAAGQGRAPEPVGSHAPLDGVVMQVWDPRVSAWTDVANHASTAMMPVEYLAAGPDARDLILSGPEELYIRLAPRGGFNGAMPPSVDIDYIETTVTYRLAAQ